ncbi:MAG TPA: hypothetical protein VN519_01310 [Bryobacteraceae bacterium]|nr:hypothetical protein [Bryobacteraceae bacterium]
MTIRLGSVTRTETPAAIDDERAYPRGIGAFHIRDGREIIADLLPHADVGTVRTLLAGRLIGYLLRQRGYLALHASAIAIDGKAALFLGESGAGKSTTAAACYSRGHQVLADDVAAVCLADRGVELQPAWPGLRLLDDSRKAIGTQAQPADFLADKYLYRLSSAGKAGAVPVKRIYFLDYHSDGELSVQSSAVRGVSAVALLNAHSLVRSWRADTRLRQVNLDRAAAVAGAAPVRRLARSRTLHLLPRLVDFVEAEMMAND